MKIYLFAFTALFFVMVIHIGCQSATTPTTQPTSIGVNSADALVASYTVAAKYETLLIKDGVLKGDTLVKIKADDTAAFNAITAAKNSALAGDSALQGAANVALAAFQKDLP